MINLLNEKTCSSQCSCKLTIRFVINIVIIIILTGSVMVACRAVKSNSNILRD